MKKWTHILLRIALSLALLLSLAACRADPGGNYNAKPVIYLYPGEETEVSVKLDFDGVLTSTYPAYGSGWTVTARPDGTLTDETGREYYCLFWEGLTETEYDFSTGFCVAGEDTAAFLEDALARLGLTEREANWRKNDFELMENCMSEQEMAQECSRCLRCDHYGHAGFKGGRLIKW